MVAPTFGSGVSHYTPSPPRGAGISNNFNIYVYFYAISHGACVTPKVKSVQEELISLGYTTFSHIRQATVWFLLNFESRAASHPSPGGGGLSGSF